MNTVAKTGKVAPSGEPERKQSRLGHWFRRHLSSRQTRLDTRLSDAIITLETRIWDATERRQSWQVRPEDLERIKETQRPFVAEADRERRKGNYEKEASLFNELASELFKIGITCEEKGNKIGAQIAYSLAASTHGYSAGAYRLGAETLEAKLHQLGGGEKEMALQDIDRLHALEATEHGSQAAFFLLTGELQKAEGALKSGAGTNAKNSEILALYEFADLIFAKEAAQEKCAMKIDVSNFPMLGKGLKMLAGIMDASVDEKTVKGQRFLEIGETMIPLPVPKPRKEEKK